MQSQNAFQSVYVPTGSKSSTSPPAMRGCTICGYGGSGAIPGSPDGGRYTGCFGPFTVTGDLPDFLKRVRFALFRQLSTSACEMKAPNRERAFSRRVAFCESAPNMLTKMPT